MRPEEVYALAVELAHEEIAGEGDMPLSADDIYPVLLALEERGLSLDSRPTNSSVPEIGIVSSFYKHI